MGGVRPSDDVSPDIEPSDTEAVDELVGKIAEWAAKKRPKPVSKDVKAARCPRPPEELVCALHDRVHIERGRLIGSKPVK